MAVYVDDMRARFGQMIMCHMLADTTAELLAMARLIGVNAKWIQRAGTSHEHFDIALSKRATAVSLGALEITWKQAGAMTARRRATGSLGSPESAVDWLIQRRAALPAAEARA